LCEKKHTRDSIRHTTGEEGAKAEAEATKRVIRAVFIIVKSSFWAGVAREDRDFKCLIPNEIWVSVRLHQPGRVREPKGIEVKVHPVYLVIHKTSKDNFGIQDTVLMTYRNMDIHIRTTIPDFYSYIEAAAIRVDESVVEMSIGNTHSFFINGKEFTDEGGKYTLQIGTQLQDGRGTIYNLDAGSTTVQIRVMKFLMSVDLQGVDPSIKEYGTGGLIGKFPTGEWLGRDQDTLFAYDGVS